MKTLNRILIISIITCSVCLSQTKRELRMIVAQLSNEKQDLRDEILALKQQIVDLKEELLNLRTENQRLQLEITTQSNQPNTNSSINLSSTSSSKNKSNSQQLAGGGRCQAITQKGTQCSRQADNGSSYCWQHKSTYEPNKTYKSTSTTGNSGSTYNGRTVHTGPRGGKYYINSNGNKTYIKRK